MLLFLEVNTTSRIHVLLFFYTNHSAHSQNLCNTKKRNKKCDSQLRKQTDAGGLVFGISKVFSIAIIKMLRNLAEKMGSVSERWGITAVMWML